MIGLRDACAKAKQTLKLRPKRERLYNKCWELDDSWVFDWRLIESYETGQVGVGLMLQVSKETGATTYFDAGLPGDENFERLLRAKIIDISEYL